MATRAAVLTGDLIASTQAGQAATDATIVLLETIAKAESEVRQAEVRFSRFRGDGWQIYCSDPKRVFRIAVLVLANLHSRPDLPKTRISAACGSISFLPETGLASASGDAFVLSGRGLDNIKREKIVYSETDGRGAWKAALFRQLEWQAFRWSPEQAQAIALAFRLDPPNPGKSAEELRISRQAFSARLDGAGYSPLWEAEHVFRIEVDDQQ